VERNDNEDLGGVLNKTDDDGNLGEVFNEVDNGKRLDCLFVFVPDKSELVVLSGDEDKRLEP